ncbi:MAG: DUF2079 domain-containing protein, partial [Chloroflexi bacterium]|nr:DUF2079 domain-containing protein [Chloroflexota bacterium]
MKRLAPAVLVLLVSLYVALFTFLAVAQHEAHHTSVFDLGVYDQAIWSTAHGRILAYSPEPDYGDNFLATHLQPILILLAPLYLVWDDVRALFLAQTLALALGVLPLYALALRKTHSPFTALVVSAAYLLLPAVEAANLFDFHPETFAPVLCISLFLMLDVLLDRQHARRRWWIALWVCVLLTLAIKEDMALIVAMLGVYVAVVRRAPRLGMTLIAVAAAWFVVGVYGVMPLFHRGQLSPFLSYYATLGTTPQSIVWNALTNPALTSSLLFTPVNSAALLAFMLPLAFLPLLDLPTFLIALPALLLDGLSDNPLMHLMEDKHYAAPIIPFALLAVVGALARLRQRAPRLRLSPDALLRVATIVLLASTLAYHVLRGYTPLSRLFHVPDVTAHDLLVQAVEAHIPSGASLAAQDRLYPHLSHREQMTYVFPEGDTSEYIFMDVAQRELLNVDNLHAWLKQQIAT